MLPHELRGSRIVVDAVTDAHQVLPPQGKLRGVKIGLRRREANQHRRAPIPQQRRRSLQCRSGTGALPHSIPVSGRERICTLIGRNPKLGKVHGLRGINHRNLNGVLLQHQRREGADRTAAQHKHPIAGFRGGFR